MLPAVAGRVRSRAGHHLHHGRERHLDISLRALPSVRHQDKRRRLTSADICAIREAELIRHLDIKPAVQSSSRRRSSFMQLRTSAPTGHHAAPDIREGLRLPWRMSSSSCSCAMETRTRSRGCRFRSRCVQDMEDILPTWSRGCHQVTLPCRFMQHAHPTWKSSRHQAGHQAAPSGQGHACPCSTPPCFSSIERERHQAVCRTWSCRFRCTQAPHPHHPAPMVDVEFWTRPAGAAFVPHGVPAPWSTPTRSRDISLRLRASAPPCRQGRAPDMELPTPSADVRFNPSRRSRGVQVMELPSFSSRPSASAGSSAAPMEEAGVPVHSSRLTSGCGRILPAIEEECVHSCSHGSGH